ncbi:hypothetical protein [Accumulibacter sp.]|uniref:hypothetical protein n=1 Tax=Accumulibacter sp. TaxID=2053492 RepID=UPI0035B210DF
MQQGITRSGLHISIPFSSVIVVALIPLFAGLLIGVGGPVVGAGLAAMLVVASALFLPINWVFWLLVITTFVLAGPIQYFGYIQKVFWLPYLIGLLMLFKALAAHLFSRRKPEHRTEKASATSVTVAVALYLITLATSSLFNAAPILQVLLSLKEYLFLIGAGFAVYWGSVHYYNIDKLLRYSHWYLVVQLPVIAYQHFFIAVKRVGPSSWDSIVGLMSGDPEGGGASATMVLIILVIMTYHLARWRQGECRTGSLVITLAVGMASIMLAEVKFAIILLPAAFGLVYLKEIVKRPIFGFSALIGSLFLAAAVLFAYQAQFASTQTKSGKSVSGYIEETIERNTGDEQINLATGEMGRIAAVKFWWRNHSVDDPLRLLLGHGIGASRIGMVAGEVAQRYRFEIGRTSLVMLLWEGGIVTAGAVIMILALGALRGLRMSYAAGSSSERAMLQTAGIALTLTLAMLPYGPDLISVSQAQLIAILSLGRILASNSTAVRGSA